MNVRLVCIAWDGTDHSVMTDLSAELKAKLVIDVDGSGDAAMADGENKVPEAPAADLKIMTAWKLARIPIGNPQLIHTNAPIQNSTIEGIAAMMFPDSKHFAIVDYSGALSRWCGVTWGIALTLAKIAKSGVKFDRRIRVVRVGKRAVQSFVDSVCASMAVLSAEFAVVSYQDGDVLRATLTHTETKHAVDFSVERLSCYKGFVHPLSGGAVDDGDLIIIDDALLVEPYVKENLMPSLGTKRPRIVLLPK